MLDIAGLSPGIGNVPDLLNAVIYVAEGDLANTALSGASAIPLVGIFSTTTKIVKTNVKSKKVVKGVGKYKTPNLNSINDFVKGAKNFDDVIADYAKFYANIVKSNADWSWNKSINGGQKLSIKQKKIIKEKAISEGYLSKVAINKVAYKKFGYADFESTGLVKETVYLPEDMWKLTDAKQFEWLNSKIGGKMKGYTWHHTEAEGKMQLVPTGIHNVTTHNGGRTAGMWADAIR